VPSERFISYPAGPGRRGPLLIGWAGWNHDERVQVLTDLIVERSAHHPDTEALTPLLASLREALISADSMHDATAGSRKGAPADSWESFLDSWLQRLGLTEDVLSGWRPPPPRRGRPRRAD
jgi:hypothetical protein